MDRIQNIRADFERHCCMDFSKEADGINYLSHTTAHAWRAWCQAAALYRDPMVSALRSALNNPNPYARHAIKTLIEVNTP